MRMLLLLACAAFAQAGLPPPPPVPEGLPAKEGARLEKRRRALVKDAARLQEDIDRQRRRCGHVDEADAAETRRCGAWRARLAEEFARYSSGLDGLSTSVDGALGAARRSRAVECAISQAPVDADFREELGRALAELRAAPATGGKGAVRVVTGGRDRAAQGRSGAGQALVRVTLQRDEETGALHIDAQSSVSAEGASERAVQNIIVLAPSGKVDSQEVSAAAAACLRTLP
ncbi:MAG: hypothetical protein HYV15_01110 [Elusimicrobia bacterium]|nr:hypothetical protein [Elusimicrobiota bacterium]